MAANAKTATESICPNGWSLPSKQQADSNTNVSDFNPVFGGHYYYDATNGESTYGESDYGFWWGAEAYNGANRYRLTYHGNLYTKYYYRDYGLYIRCVSEEKTVTDLTYMQDMTPKIAPALSLCI